MTVETATYISQLDSTLPTVNDPKSEGDDHIRLTKSVLKAQFSNLGASPVTVTASDLNSVTGKASKSGDTYSGAHDMTAATVTVATQSATDASTKAASTQMVQNAILASSGITATLPGQAGNSGKFLSTDGTSPGWQDAVTPAGTQTLTNKTIKAVVVQETRVALSSGTAIDLSAGNVFTKTISGATSLTVSNVPTSGTVASFILELTNPGTNVTFWSGVKWSGGSAPVLTVSGVDVLGFYTHDGGTTWRGMVLARDSK